MKAHKTNKPLLWLQNYLLARPAVMPRESRSALSGVESPGIRAFGKRSRLVGFS